MFKIGLKLYVSEADEKLFSDYQSAGIEVAEIGKPELLDDKNLTRVASKYGVELRSLHLPFKNGNYMDRKDHAAGAVAAHTEIIKKAAELGTKIFVVHPSGESFTEPERPEAMKCAKESLAALADAAAKYGAVIAVEDLPRTCLGRTSDEMLELLSAHPALRVCFDTNHLLFEDPVDFIHKVGDKIVTTHVSDYDLLDERHWLPGEGKIDWQALLQALIDVNYKGPWLYELGFKAPSTIVRNRDLTCEDFGRNAREIFAGQKPTVISTPVEGLQKWKPRYLA